MKNKPSSKCTKECYCSCPYFYDKNINWKVVCKCCPYKKGNEK